MISKFDNDYFSYLKHCRLAKLFEQLIRTDDIFEIIGDVILGLVCFRMIASEEMNQELLTKFANFSYNFYQEREVFNCRKRFSGKILNPIDKFKCLSFLITTTLKLCDRQMLNTITFNMLLMTEQLKTKFFWTYSYGTSILERTFRNSFLCLR